MSDTPPSPALLSQSDLPVLIQRYLNGESIRTLAADASKTRQTIYNWMHLEGEEQYPKLVKQAMLARMANADQSLEDATDSLGVARAREEARFARWDIERRWSDKFGLKQEVKMDTQITVVIQRLTEEPKTIEIRGEHEEP